MGHHFVHPVRHIISAVLCLLHDTDVGPIRIEPDPACTGSVFQRQVETARRHEGRHEVVVLSLALWADKAHKGSASVDTVAVTLTNLSSKDQTGPHGHRVVAYVCLLGVVVCSACLNRGCLGGGYRFLDVPKFSHVFTEPGSVATRRAFRTRYRHEVMTGLLALVGEHASEGVSTDGGACPA